MKKSLVVILFSLLFLALTGKIFAAVVLNEVSPATSPEWVELYNANPDSVSLQGYIIDFGSDNQKKSFCDNDLISGNSYRAISLTASWLNNEGDTVTLKSGSDVVDSISYGVGTSLRKPNNTQSIARSSDGSSNWILTDIPTQQGDAVSFECPTPTPTPSPTPTPIKSGPTPTPSPKPTKTPTPIKSGPTPTPTKKADSTPTKSSTTLIPTKNSPSPTSQGSSKNKSAAQSTITPVSQVLGANETIVETPTPTNIQKENAGRSPVGKFVTIFGGILLTSSCGILMYKKYRKEKENEI